MLSTHYRKPMDWTEKKANEAYNTLWRWHEKIEDIEVKGKPTTPIVAALADDLNTVEALRLMQELDKNGKLSDLKANAELLGLLSSESAEWFRKKRIAEQSAGALREILDIRECARKEKNYARADLIRDLLKEHAVEIEDLGDGKFKPKTSAVAAAEYFGSLSSDERKEAYGGSLGDDGKTIELLARLWRDGGGLALCVPRAHT